MQGRREVAPLPIGGRRAAEGCGNAVLNRGRSNGVRRRVERLETGCNPPGIATILGYLELLGPLL